LLPKETTPRGYRTDRSETRCAMGRDVSASGALAAGLEGGTARSEAAAEGVDMRVRKEECDADYDR